MDGWMGWRGGGTRAKEIGMGKALGLAVSKG